jgi:hypothetical protein
MRKALKFLHTLGSCGLIGGLLAYIVLIATTPADPAQAYAAMRTNVSAICLYVLLPSLGVTLVSGLLSISAHRPFQELRWVWVKALFGIAVFKATTTIQSTAASIATLAGRAATGQPDAEALAAALTREWQLLALILFLFVGNVVLGIWRPALRWPGRAKTAG